MRFSWFFLLPSPRPLSHYKHELDSIKDTHERWSWSNVQKGHWSVFELLPLQKSLTSIWEMQPEELWPSWEPQQCGLWKLFPCGVGRKGLPSDQVRESVAHLPGSPRTMNRSLTALWNLYTSKQLHKVSNKRSPCLLNQISGGHRGLWELWTTTKQAHVPPDVSSPKKWEVSLHNFPTAQCTAGLSVWLFPLILSERKPETGIDLACYHLVVQSLKESFNGTLRRHSLTLAGHPKGSTGEIVGPWNAKKGIHHTHIHMSRLLRVWETCALRQWGRGGERLVDGIEQKNSSWKPKNVMSVHGS